MRESLNIVPIAHISSDFPGKFGIPRQSGLVEELCARIIFEPEYRDPNALRGIEDYSHLWLIWGFSENQKKPWSPTVRPPRLGGNTRMGVFATRSPFRPNPLGLSLVKLIGTEHTQKNGTVIHVSGADLMDKTPIYDIKPYLPDYESKPDARGGISEQFRDYRLRVECPDELLEKLPCEKRSALIAILSQDPRPSYQDDPMRIYSFEYAGFKISFKVEASLLTVCAISPEND